MKYLPVKCFWCKKEFNQRQDTVKRQLSKYGHNCCKHCFGKEKSFKDARTRIMNENNPFEGKSHTRQAKIKIGLSKIGKPSWNKGLNAIIDERVRKNGEMTAIGIAGKILTGSGNNNWKGGISYITPKFPSRELFSKWIKFREEVLEESFFRCYKCSEVLPKKQLDIHHLLSQTRHQDHIYDSRNCVVFCKTCHKNFHAEFGNKKFTPMDAINFINRKRSRENYFKTC